MKVGLSLNLEKCKLWGPGIQTKDQPTPSYPDELALDHPGRVVPVVPYGGENGITALGVPIDAPRGTPRREPFVAPECKLRWTTVVEQTRLLLTRLRAYPEGQVRLTLLRYCLDAYRGIHLLRSMELEEAGDSPGILRAVLQQATQDLLATCISEYTWEKVRLPIGWEALESQTP